MTATTRRFRPPPGRRVRIGAIAATAAGSRARETKGGRAPAGAARGPNGGGPSDRPERARSNGPDSPSIRLFIGAGRQAGIRPGDLVGAITGEAGVESRSLGAIEIADRFSLIEVPDNLADEIITALKKATIRGKTVMVRRERPTV